MATKEFLMNLRKKYHLGEFSKKGKKRLITEFEGIRESAELRALSKISLERNLTERELKRFKELMIKY